MLSFPGSLKIFFALDVYDMRKKDQGTMVDSHCFALFEKLSFLVS